MVQCGLISIYYFRQLIFCILFITSGTITPHWNLIFVGVEQKLNDDTIFPYPFSLIFIQNLFCCILFIIFNLIERFLIPYCLTRCECNCIKDDDLNTTQSLFKVNEHSITDNISKPGLYDPTIDFNQKSLMENDNHKIPDFHPESTNNISNKHGLNGSHISFINDDLTATSSQITQFSCYTNQSYTSTFSAKTIATTTTTTTTQTTMTTTTTHTLSAPSTTESGTFRFNTNVSWCFDSNFYLKLKITSKSGILFGLNSFFFIAASLFVPININIAIRSCILMFITIYVKMIGLETSNLLFIISLLIILLILPFAINYPLKSDDLYLNNKQVADGTLYIVISIICDFIASGLLILNILSISSLIKLIKPSRMRFENDKEPSIIEISFFISFWSMIILSLPCLICDLLFHQKQHLLTSNISSTNNYNHTIIDLITDHVIILRYLIISIFNQLFYTFSFIACLSIMNILTISILYELVIIIYAIIYLILILNEGWISLFKLSNISLLFSLSLCFLYTIIRIIQNKKLSHLTWNEYWQRSTRIDSTESFNTLLSHKTNKSKNKYISSNNNKENSKSINDKEKINENNNNHDNNHKDSIMSISTDDGHGLSLNDEDITYTQSVTRSAKKKYDGPATHSNRYGLPEYVRTPPSLDVITRTESPPLTQDDVLFHISRIQDNMSYYKQNKKNKKRKKRKKKKKNNKDKNKDKETMNKTIKQRSGSLDDVV